MKNAIYKHTRNIQADFYAWWNFQKAKKQGKNLDDIYKPFFITAIPGSLHIIDLCLRFIPASQSVVLVSNGISDWEYQWALDHLAVDSNIRFKRMLRHADVIDFLFNNLDKPFGIIDYDCFVMKPLIFEKISAVKPGYLANAFFNYENPVIGLEIPETFLLFFNTPLMKVVQEKYHINSQRKKLKQLSRPIKKELLKIGINEENYPELHKNFFDTLRLWFCLGIADGYAINYIDKLTNFFEPSGVINHVGGSSYNNKSNNIWDMRGTYFWRRALESCGQKDIQEYYWKKFGELKSHNVLEMNPQLASQFSEEFLDFTNKIVTYYD
ncbi:MAG TPA: hypothetical protein DCK95_05715 [Anaerolineaceae bacterium]|nr:hypothetical protein [Anaerolineaceae bacterium]